MTEAEEEFREFAAAVQGHLRRSAYLLCGDWHLAEDFVQAAFVKIFQSWRRVRTVENRHAYARQVVFRCFLDHQRKNKRRIATVPLEGLPEPAAPTDEDAYSGAVLEVLATLPPGARAVIVLRFWEDLSVVSIDDEYEFVPSDSHHYAVDLRISTHVAHEQYLANPPKDYYDPAGWPPKDDPHDAFNPGGALISQDGFLALIAKPDFAEVAAVLDPTTPPAASATDKRHAADDTIAAAVKPLLPDGLTLTIDPNDFMTSTLILSGPSGTNKFQWYASAQQKNWQPGWACEVHTEKECTYTVVPGGIVQVEHYGDAIANTAPDAKSAYRPGSDQTPTNYRDVFRYLPNDPNGTILQIVLDEQIRDIPWAATKPTTGPYASYTTWPPPARNPDTAFNPDGPLLTPDQFAAIAKAPGITAIVQTVNLALDPAFAPR